MKYLLILFSFFIFFHGDHVAEYYYQLDGQDLNLKFVIEKEALNHFEFKEACDFENMTALCTAKYLEKNSFLRINNKKIKLELQDAYTQGVYLIVLLNTELENGIIEKIKIKNKSFYAFDPSFKNRIILDVGPFQKSYLLNRKHNKLKLKK